MLKKGPPLHQYHLEAMLLTVRQPTQPPILRLHYRLEIAVVTVDKAEAEAEQEQKREQEDCSGHFRHS
jgi:hypothetical protein